MPVGRRRRMALVAPGAAAVLALALTVAPASPVFAATADFSIDLDAGVACAGFPLRIEGSGDKRIMREFTDRNGQVVRMLSAGKGFSLTFTNVKTGSSIMLPSNGSVSRTRVNADGTTIVDSTGHNVVIFFPTDIPRGPSTTLYVGRIVSTVDTHDVFTLRSVSGKTPDLCALLG